MQATPSFDTWTSVFLFAVAMGLFLFFSILLGKNKKHLPIGLLVLAFSLILFQYVLYWTRYEEVIPYFGMLPHLCYYTTGPLLYLYFLTLYKKDIRFNYAWHFLPAFLVLITYSAVLANYLWNWDLTIPWRWFSQNPWFIAVHMGFYTLASLKLVVKSKTETEFEILRKRWTKILILLYATFLLAYISYYVLVNFDFFNSEWDYMISFTMSASIYLIGYFIMKEPQVFDGEFLTELFLPVQNKDASFEESLLHEFYQKLTKHMVTEKPYIDNELRLVNLADQLGFSTHLLSKVINKKSGKNFNQFVNEYRLQEAKRLLHENPEYSVKTIYFDVGFNNKATFYNAFKKEFQCTPLEFRDSMASSS
jgi:AraC-like DNA-binding protein